MRGDPAAAQAPPRVRTEKSPDEGGVSRAQVTTEHYSCYYEGYDPAPADLKALGRDLQKLLLTLRRVPSSAARQCTADLTDAYNAVAKARMARRGR